MCSVTNKLVTYIVLNLKVLFCSWKEYGGTLKRTETATKPQPIQKQNDLSPTNGWVLMCIINRWLGSGPPSQRSVSLLSRAGQRRAAVPGQLSSSSLTSRIISLTTYHISTAGSQMLSKVISSGPLEFFYMVTQGWLFMAFSFLLACFLAFFLGLHPWYMEVPRLGVESDL